MSKLNLQPPSVKLFPKIRGFLLKLTLVLVAALAALYTSNSQMSPTRATSSPLAALEGPGESDNFMYAAAYSTIKGQTSTLVLNNAMDRDVTARVTLYNRQGQALVIPDISLNAHDNGFFNVSDWLEALRATDFSEGSVEVFFHGPFMGLGAQVVIADSARSLSFDVPFAGGKEFASSKLDSLWWGLESKTQAQIFLANTTGQITVVTPTLYINGDAMESEPIVLGSHASTTLDMKKLLNKLDVKEKPAKGGISLRHDNQPGALAVAGALTDKGRGFSSTLRFVDLAMQRSNNLHGAHLLIGRPGLESGLPLNANFAPNVLVRNTTNAPVRLKATVRYRSNTTANSIEIAQKPLAANEVRRIDLSPVTQAVGKSRLTDAGVEIEHQGEAGAVIAAAASLNAGGNHVFDVPVKDPKSPGNAGGSYPFKIDGDNRAVVHLKNIDPLTDGEPRQLGMMFTYEGGMYSLPVQLVEAGQTMAIDIKKIRDDQIPDSHDNVIPLTVTKGQVQWFGRGMRGQFIGRLVQYNPTLGMTSSASCSSFCSCDPSYESGFITPNNGQEIAGGTIGLRAFEVDRTCGGGTFTCEVTSIATFESCCPSVATMGGATAHLEDQGGTAQVTATWNTSSSFFGLDCEPQFITNGKTPGQANPSFVEPPFGGCCNHSPQTGLAFANVTSLQAKIDSAQSIKDGATASFHVTAQGGTVTSYQWSFTSPNGAVNGPSVSFNPATGSDSTTTDGHWFALPNNPCSASFDAVYTIKCKVTFSGGKMKTPQSTLTVNALWNPAGLVDPNQARVTGVPAMAADGAGVWRITGMGTLARQIPQKQVFVPNSSQFFTKSDSHEQEHLNHWNAGNLFGGVHQPAAFFARIQNFTGVSQQDLLNKVIADFQIYTGLQDTFVNNNIAQSERLAYQVSDPIAPQFLYQNCGRF